MRPISAATSMPIIVAIGREVAPGERRSGDG
jgi:hypothetical protein